MAPMYKSSPLLSIAAQPYPVGRSLPSCRALSANISRTAGSIGVITRVARKITRRSRATLSVDKTQQLTCTKRSTLPVFSLELFFILYPPLLSRESELLLSLSLSLLGASCSAYFYELLSDGAKYRAALYRQLATRLYIRAPLFVFGVFFPGFEFTTLKICILAVFLPNRIGFSDTSTNTRVGRLFRV